jgi:hypothetical protein
LGHDPCLVQALQCVEEVAGALDPYSGIEQRFLGQVLQIVGKVGQLMQKQVGRKRANGAREAERSKTSQTIGCAPMEANRPAFSADLVIAPTV